MTDAQSIYNYLVDEGIIVRNRSRIQLCNNCLRITIGTRTENTELISALRKYQA
jgi:histidinol-phosphate aminotransferase